MASTLAELKPGEQGVVKQIEGQGSLHRHLLDMGLTPGTRVQLKKVAPMGDPMEIVLRGYSLTLRREDAARVALKEGE